MRAEARTALAAQRGANGTGERSFGVDRAPFMTHRAGILFARRSFVKEMTHETFVATLGSRVVGPASRSLASRWTGTNEGPRRAGGLRRGGSFGRPVGPRPPAVPPAPPDADRRRPRGGL